MRCAQARVALSARLDGEDPGPDAVDLAGHLADCADCRRWLATARRLVPVTRAPVPTPDLTRAVLTRVAAERADQAAAARAAAARRRRRLRLAVGLSGAVQLLLALPGLLGLDGEHAGREAAAFDVALAAGFLFAAYRPTLARAYAPLALVLAGCLAVTGGVDLLYGRAGLGHEVTHLVAVAQAGLLWALARRYPPGESDPLGGDPLWGTDPLRPARTGTAP
jgi:predicted anti-sigma-YlaC factor YlaD